MDLKKKEIVGVSKHMKDIRETIKEAAATDSTVLIQGPTGTGKELIANNIHFKSKRKSRKFVPINCGAIPGDLFESEIFGHAKGAFTDAFLKKEGMVAVADGGTIFLDEIGELAPEHQVKLLRFLQDGSYTPVGETKEQRSDVRVIAATNKDLVAMKKKGTFRDDLYQRLKELPPIYTKPLVDRPEDVIALVNHFIFTKRLRTDPRVKFLLYSYELPGNARELEYMVGWTYEHTREELERWRKEMEPDKHDDLFSQRRLEDAFNFLDNNGSNYDYDTHVRLYEIFRLYYFAEINKKKIAETLHIRAETLSPSKFIDRFGLDFPKTENFNFWGLFTVDNVYRQLNCSPKS